MIRQDNKNKRLLIQTHLKNINCQHDNMQYLDLVKLLEKMGCFGASYIHTMKEENVRNLTTLWQELTQNNTFVNAQDIIHHLLVTKPQQYKWVFKNIIDSKTRAHSPASSCESLVDYESNKENMNVQNMYVRKRVDKICEKFRVPAQKSLFVNPFNSVNCLLKKR